MDTLTPDDFDARQVSLFIERIATDRDDELRDIAARRDVQIARIRRDAWAESRRLFRQGAGQLGERLAQERSRHLAGLRAELRRQQWAILAAAQQRVLDAVAVRFQEAWQDPRRQAEWCRFWLQAALQRAGDQALHITLGRGATASLRAQIEAEIGPRAGGAAVNIDAQAEPGIRIEWGDYVMDGRLASQTPALADVVLGRLSELLYRGDGDTPG